VFVKMWKVGIKFRLSESYEWLELNNFINYI